MRFRFPPPWLLSIAAVLAAAGVVRADVILTNLPGTPSVTGTNLGLGSDNAHRKKAVGLRTADQPLAFESMLVWMDNSDPVTRTLIGGIYSDIGDRPGLEVASFTPADVPAGSDNLPVTLTAAGDFILAPDTTYWFLLDGPSVTNTLLWAMLTPDTAPTGSGVTWEGYRFSSNGGSTWVSSQSFNTIEIRASAIPEPGALFLLLPAAGVLLRRRR